MKNNFLENQPHPETDETSCIHPDDSAKSLKPCLETTFAAAVLCGGAWVEDQYILVTSNPEKPRNVFIYRGNEPDSLDKKQEFALFEYPVTGISCFESKEGGGVCICAGDIFIFNLNGEPLGKFPVTAIHASILCDNENFWICYDGKLRQINSQMDGFTGPPADITASSYLIYQNRRRDALDMEGRRWPGKKGGCLFLHQGRYYYFFGDNFNRHGRNNYDSFCCTADSLTGHFQRRYLVIPNGGIINVFHGKEGKLYAAFTGSKGSITGNKPSILPLEIKDDEFIRPTSAYILETGQVPSLRPFRDIELRDTFIFNAPDGFYYMTGTTRRPGGTFWAGTDGINIWKSLDLKTFEKVGKVFDYHDTPESWQNNVSGNLNCWAPEITYYSNTFWITYSTAPGCGLLMSKSGRIEGPYLDMGRVVNKGIDSGFFLEDETLFLVWQNGFIAPLSRNANTMTEEPIMLLPEDGQQVGYEGAGIIKVGSKYVLYAAEWNGDARIDGTYDMMYSTADNLYGPYCKRSLLVPHGGHGCLFYDKNGQLRFTMFGNDRSAPFRRRAGIGHVFVTEQENKLILAV